MGPGLPAPGDPRKAFILQPANQDLSPEKPSPCQFRAAAQSWSQARVGQVRASATMAFPLLEWEERNWVDPPPLIFFACKTGSLDGGDMGQGLQGRLESRPDHLMGLAGCSSAGEKL